ncbi:MAG TPA: DNA repair protein RecO [Candidatus Binataceae bacterium]|nr:DNA repair protein RecO [Candidatus Binataceae bacterium]
MPAEESTPAIVLRARDYAESDRIVTLLTRDFGKLSGIAKGAKASRRRFERKLEPFSHVTLFFRRRPHGQLVFITRAEAGDLPPLTAEDDLARFALGTYMLELTEALTSEEAEAAAAYRILADALRLLVTATASLAIRQGFELAILRASGFGLEFSRCRACGTLDEDHLKAAYFIPSRGGVICPRCRPAAPETAVRLNPAIVAAMARLNDAPLTAHSSLDDGGPDGAQALARFLASILDRRLRSAAFLDTLL